MVGPCATLAEGWECDVVSIGVPSPVHGGRIVADPVEPRPGLGRLRLRGRVREADEGGERRRDAGARQLRGRHDALPRARHRARLGAGRRRASSSRWSSATCPYRKATFEDYVGEAALRAGREEGGAGTSQRSSTRSTAALEPDYVVLGGGNADEARRAAAGLAARRQRERVPRRLPPLGRRLEPRHERRLANVSRQDERERRAFARLRVHGQGPVHLRRRSRARCRDRDRSRPTPRVISASSR